MLNNNIDSHALPAKGAGTANRHVCRLTFTGEEDRATTLCVPIANESFNAGFKVGPMPRSSRLVVPTLLYLSVQIPLHTRVPDLRLPCLV